RRSASFDASSPGEGPTRPMRTRRRSRIAFRIAKVLLAIVLVFAAAVGLLFLLTPSAGQATALAREQARDRHIAYPGPPVPAYFAPGYYGLDAASGGYFGRPADRLTLVQAAMLAGVVNAPSYDDPLVYPRQARTRLVHVIGRMAAVGYLTQAQETAALNAPLGLSAVRGCACPSAG